MIDINPSQGNWTDYLEYTYRDTSANVTQVLLHDTPPIRQSNVLGPNGEPVYVDTPRLKIGFDLTPKAKP